MRNARPTGLNKIGNPELRAPLLELKQQRDRARLHPAKPAPKTNGAATGPRTHTASETINNGHFLLLLIALAAPGPSELARPLRQQWQCVRIRTSGPN
jgi:hypothetical protein